MLAGCYRESLRLAVEHRIGSIAFTAISCGVFGYPPDVAVQVAVREARAGLLHAYSLRRIVFCCFGAGMASRYREELED